MVLFTDYTSLLLNDSNDLDFNININQSFCNIISWFNSNSLILHFNKTHYVEFRMKNYHQVKTKVKYEQKNISNSTETTFKKSKTYCTPIYTKNNLLCLYTSHIKLWHNFLGGDLPMLINYLFYKTKIFRIITNTEVRESCRKAFKNMEIMMFYSQYIFSLILFTVKNKHLFTSNKEIHKCKTRNNLHLPTVNKTKFYKGPYVSGSKDFNHLPQYIKILISDMKYFKLSLMRFLYHHIFYSTEEYFEYDEDKDM